MAEPRRFADLPADEKVAFLDRARAENPGVDPVGTAFAMEVPLGWGCGNCGWGFPLKDVLVLEAIPHCPNCDESGWHFVFPR
jgi:hypothetical protein